MRSIAESPDEWYTRTADFINNDCDLQMAETRRGLQRNAFQALCGAAVYLVLRKDPATGVGTRVCFGGMWTLLVFSTAMTLRDQAEIKHQQSIRMAEARHLRSKQKRRIERAAAQQNDTRK